MTDHTLTLRKIPYFSAPIIYIASCSCGAWESGKSTVPGPVEQSWRQHKAAKERST